MSATAPQVKTTDDTTSPWYGFRTGLWQKQINVRDFIQQNYEPYDGDESFLAPATKRTQGIWDMLQAMFVEERKKRVLDVSQIPSSITAQFAVLHRSRKRDHRRAPDRRAAHAQDHAERGLAAGHQRPEGLRLRA
jgi:pyruvate-formate lyase